MNILIIGGAGYSPDANSVCIRNMTKEFVSEGHKVWILSMGDDYIKNPGRIEGATLCQQPMDYYRRLTFRTSRSNLWLLHLWFRIISVLRHVALIPFYPITSPNRSRILAKKAKWIVKENDIKVAICVFNPYDNIYAGIKLKKFYKDDIKVVSYHLDLRTASLNPLFLVRDYIRKHALQSLVYESKTVDKILIPYSGEKETEEVKGIDKNKICYVGFPMYIERIEMHPCDLPFNKNDINISYIGSLSKDNRNPGPILKMIETVSILNKKRIVVHFWGSVGDAQAIIDRSQVAKYHGNVENQYVSYIMSKSDFLLNIGNALAYDMLPSKVFGMFVTGKPIINYISHPQDATIPYFERYNNSIDIKAFDFNQEEVDLLADYLNTNNTEPESTKDLLFEDFTPAYICRLILNI